MWPPSRPGPSVQALTSAPGAWGETNQAKILPIPLSGSSNLNCSLRTLSHHKQAIPIMPNHPSFAEPPATSTSESSNLLSLLFRFSGGEIFLLLSQANLCLLSTYPLLMHKLPNESINAPLSCIYRHSYFSRCHLILSSKKCLQFWGQDLNWDCRSSIHSTKLRVLHCWTESNTAGAIAYIARDAFFLFFFFTLF